jgi:hypothetical protein
MKTAMTVRENLHHLVDTLPENRLEDALNLLDQLDDDDTLSPEEQAALERAEADFREGRTVSWEEYKRTHGL